MRKVLFLMLCVGLSSTVSAVKRPKNIIFVVADGMGLSQVYAAMTANGNKLELEACTTTGFCKTYSYDNYITDSAAGATALACGVKTRNGMVGLKRDSSVVASVLSEASKIKLATGLVAVSDLTQSTPASFVAHVPNRDMNEEIAENFCQSKLDVFIGGGLKYFEDRNDGKNLTDSLKQNKYKVVYTMDDVKASTGGKLAGLLYDEQIPLYPERGSYLQTATLSAIDILDNNPRGFFLAITGSTIDWAGHDNNSTQLTKEMLDVDQTIGKILEYARKTKNTLVVITGNHETGGMALLGGQMGTDQLKIAYSSRSHTATPVPVFAYGPGAELFSGIYENTDLKLKFENLLKIVQK